MMRAPLAAALAGLALVAGAPAAHGFGTWDTPVIPGNGEHERITRMALDCSGAFARAASTSPSRPATDCAEPRTMMMIAGGKGYLGGVGAADSAYEATLDRNPAQHCRGDGPREAALMACRRAFVAYMDDTVKWAGGLAYGNGTVVASEAAMPARCDDDYDALSPGGEQEGTGPAKCRALISFGRALHIAEDVLAHTNWVDTRGVQTADDLPEIVRYPRTDAQVAGFLAGNPGITGAVPAGRDIGAAGINWRLGTIPPGEDGGDGFTRAASAGAVAAATSWADLKGAIQAAYPGAKGAAAWRALTTDTPWTDCEMSGASSRAMMPGRYATSGPRMVGVTVRNTMARALACESAVLDWGQWSRMPPDVIPAQGSGPITARSVSDGVAGTKGSVTYRTRPGSGDTRRVTITWDNPPSGRGVFSCSTRGKASCSITGGMGDSPSIDVTVTTGAAANGRSTVTLSGRGAGGSTVEGEALRRAERESREPAPIDVPMSDGEVADIPVQVGRMRACEGDAERIALAVDDVSCAWALGALKRLSEDLCPPGWDYRPVPDGRPVLCVLSAPEGSGASGDRAAKAFRYLLPDPS